MKTRIKDLPEHGAISFSFQYTEFKKPLEHQWHFVGGAAHPVRWASAWRRNQARACFTHRRSVQAALADLERLGLLPTI